MLTIAVIGERRSPSRVLGAASAGALERLVAAHDRWGGARVVVVRPRRLDDAGWWSRSAGDSSAVLVIETSRDGSAWHPATGPFVTAEDGRVVAVGLLTTDLLPGAANAAEQVSRRPARVGPIALLGSARPRTKAAFDELEAAWPSRTRVASPRRWTSDRIGWEDLRPGLASGLGGVLYLGHGEVEAWPAYGGITADRLTDAVLGPIHRMRALTSLGGSAPDDDVEQPIAVLLALTCDAAGAATAEGGLPARAFDPGSIAARLVAEGTVGAALAAVGSVEHDVNRSLAVAVMAAIGRGRSTLAEVVSAMARDASVARGLAAYRIIGDPLVRLSGEATAWAAADGVPATDPAEPLPAAGSGWPARPADSTGTLAPRAT